MATRQGEVMAMVGRIRRVGWDVEQMNGGSGGGYKVTCPDGARVQLHLTPSDVNHMRTVERELNKHGFKDAEAEAELADLKKRASTIKADRAKADAATKRAQERSAALQRAAGPYAVVQPTLAELLAPHAVPRTYEHVLVDAEMAAAMMERNDPRNRPLRDAWVQEWIQVLRALRWLYTHQGIAFNTAGLIQDGQHRLTAVQTSGIAAEFQITVGLPDENFKVLDSGHGRTAGSILAMEGEEHATSLAAMARLLYLYETWGSSLLMHTRQRVSNSAVVSMAESMRGDDATEAMNAAYRMRREIGKMGVGGVSAAFYLLLGAMPRDDARPSGYIEDLILGVRDENDPAYLVRRQITRQGTGGARKMSTAETMVLIIKGWNARVEGRKTAGLVVRPGTAVPAIVVPE